MNAELDTVNGQHVLRLTRGVGTFQRATTDLPITEEQAKSLRIHLEMHNHDCK